MEIYLNYIYIVIEIGKSCKFSRNSKDMAAKGMASTEMYPRGQVAYKTFPEFKLA